MDKEINSLSIKLDLDVMRESMKQSLKEAITSQIPIIGEYFVFYWLQVSSSVLIGTFNPSFLNVVMD
jgi:hypothetical protein